LLPPVKVLMVLVMVVIVLIAMIDLWLGLKE
jgi:hypothetical protein